MRHNPAVTQRSNSPLSLSLSLSRLTQSSFEFSCLSFELRIQLVSLMVAARIAYCVVLDSN